MVGFEVFTRDPSGWGVENGLDVLDYLLSRTLVFDIPHKCSKVCTSKLCPNHGE
jgi:hypothetical protein